MSLYIEFDPHSWYKDFAIKRYAPHMKASKLSIPWYAVTDNGNTYQVDTIEAETLKQLKQLITDYRAT